MTIIESWEDTDYSEWSPDPLTDGSRVTSPVNDGSYALNFSSNPLITSSLGDGLSVYPDPSGEYKIALNFHVDTGEAGLLFNYIDSSNYYVAQVSSSIFKLSVINGGSETVLNSVVVRLSSWASLTVLHDPTTGGIKASVYDSPWPDVRTPTATINGSDNSLNGTATFGFQPRPPTFGSAVIDDIYIVSGGQTPSNPPAAPTNLTASDEEQTITT